MWNNDDFFLPREDRKFSNMYEELSKYPHII